MVTLLTMSFSVLVQNGGTALITAAQRGDATVVSLLLDAKADVDAANIVRQFPQYRIHLLLNIFFLTDNCADGM
jgi:ankyrin repeat protein